jgi:hypothetical protein
MGIIHNSTDAELYQSWKSMPEGRGTLSIIYSCLFTVFIYAWSALHQNVPADDDSKSQVFWRKVKWMLIGILAPEFIAVTALDEYLAVQSEQNIPSGFSTTAKSNSLGNIVRYINPRGDPANKLSSPVQCLDGAMRRFSGFFMAIP